MRTTFLTALSDLPGRVLAISVPAIADSAMRLQNNFILYAIPRLGLLGENGFK